MKTKFRVSEVNCSQTFTWWFFNVLNGNFKGPPIRSSKVAVHTQV